VPGHYFGYFENEHREQFIFVYDYKRKQGTLWMGDNGWDNGIPITNPEKPDVILSKSEWLWLQQNFRRNRLMQQAGYPLIVMKKEPIHSHYYHLNNVC